MQHQILFFALFFLIAFLYSSVGQAGGSSYVGFLLVMGFSSAETKITSLAMNIIVSALASFIFSRFDFRKIKPVIFLLIGAIPFAFLTGKIVLAENIYKWVSVFFLLLSAALLHIRIIREEKLQHNNFWIFLLIGICIGSIAGITGIGGGILLSPVLITLGLLDIKSATGITSMYNLIVSLTAFCGYASRLGFVFPAMSTYWFFSVAIGGALGAFVGKRYLPANVLKIILTILLIVASALIVIN